MAPAIVKTTWQSATLAAVANVIAQVIKAQRAGVPLVLDFKPLYRFVVFALLNTPPNVLWQNYLEMAYPGGRPVPVTAKTLQEGQLLESKRETNWSNIVKKFLLDQTIGAALNNLAFIAIMGSLEGLDGSQVSTKVQEELLPLQFAGYKFWPIVSVLSFTVIPPSQRVIFGSLAGVAWGVFLSLL